MKYGHTPMRTHPREHTHENNKMRTKGGLACDQPTTTDFHPGALWLANSEKASCCVVRCSMERPTWPATQGGRGANPPGSGSGVRARARSTAFASGPETQNPRTQPDQARTVSHGNEVTKAAAGGH